MENPVIEIRKLDPGAIIPHYRHEGDAGFDFATLKDIVVPGNGVAILPTGLAIALPDGFELQIRLRSGAALNTPLIIPNAPATIDAGYRGELGIIVRNMDAAPFLVARGERLAQGILCRVARAIFRETDLLPPSDRADCGYGSTGRI